MLHVPSRKTYIALLAGSLLAALCSAADSDIPKTFTTPTANQDYIKREAMIPMRDGVKLYTVIVVPKGAKNAPILLTRTPYNAAKRTARSNSPHMLAILPQGDGVFVAAGYIRVFQDIRGKYKSEGDYLMTRPPRGPLNTTSTDETTDAYDTIDWLVKNTPESNGRVGMIGSSYEGFTVVMALLGPHPALRVAAPESPMVDGWMGDDWFHYGAFRQVSLDYFLGQTTNRGAGVHVPREGRDEYSNYLRAGSAGDFARAQGQDQLPLWHTFEQNPTYDAFWQSQALDKLIAKIPQTVPTMWEQGLWDQEDMWGAIHSYRALEPRDRKNNMNYLVMGPWRHSQVNREGRTLGPFTWASDTTAYWRKEVLLPFFNQYLKPDSPRADTPPVLIYNPGEDHWDRLKEFPASCEKDCPVATKPLFLEPDGALSFTAPTTDGAGPGAPEQRFDEYVSDPPKPLPYRPRPIATEDNAGWGNWLVTDQRFVDGRPDVLTYETEPLTEPMKLSGEPVAHLFASTSGKDSA